MRVYEKHSQWYVLLGAILPQLGSPEMIVLGALAREQPTIYLNA